MANQKKKGKNKKGKGKSQNQPQAQQTAAPEPQEDLQEMVTLEFDDGTEVECFVEGVFTCNDEDYMALIPNDKSGDVYIYRYVQTSDEDYRLEDETIPKRFEAAVRAYEKLKGHVSAPKEEVEEAAEAAEPVVEEAAEAVEEAVEEVAEPVAEEVAEEAEAVEESAEEAAEEAAEAVEEVEAEVVEESPFDDEKE